MYLLFEKNCLARQGLCQDLIKILPNNLELCLSNKQTKRMFLRGITTYTTNTSKFKIFLDFGKIKTICFQVSK